MIESPASTCQDIFDSLIGKCGMKYAQPLRDHHQNQLIQNPSALLCVVLKEPTK